MERVLAAHAAQLLVILVPLLLFTAHTVTAGTGGWQGSGSAPGRHAQRRDINMPDRYITSALRAVWDTPVSLQDLCL